MSDYKAKMYKIQFQLGLCPTPHWGSLQRSPDSLAGLIGHTFNGRGRDGMGRGGGGRGRKGEGEGRDPTPLRPLMHISGYAPVKRFRPTVFEIIAVQWVKWCLTGLK